jgi:rieske iron-sulfur protein
MVTPSPDERPAQPDDIAGLALYRAQRQTRQEQRVAARRRVLQWVIGIGAGAFSIALLLPALALRSLTRETKDVAAGDTLVYATGGHSGSPITAASIQPGTAVQAFPQGKSDNERNLIELVRLGEDLPAGLVAYSAICTHLGCTVLANLTAEGDILCPCHGSMFDPAADAKVLRGPANRPLPSLPLAISANGQIAAAGGFSGPIGPQ